MKNKTKESIKKLTLEEELKQLDNSFEQIRIESVKNGKENWEFLERLIKEGSYNNSHQILNAVQVIVSEEQRFHFEKRKYHTTRNALQKGYDIAITEIKEMDEEEKLLITDGKQRGIDYEVCKKCGSVITASVCIQCGYEND